MRGPGCPYRPARTPLPCSISASAGRGRGLSVAVRPRAGVCRARRCRSSPCVEALRTRRSGPYSARRSWQIHRTSQRARSPKTTTPPVAVASRTTSSRTTGLIPRSASCVQKPSDCDLSGTSSATRPRRMTTATRPSSSAQPTSWPSRRDEPSKPSDACSRLEVAAELGISQHASRLQGETRAELVADGRALAKEFGIDPSGDGQRPNFSSGVRRPVQRPKTMNDVIRQAAGR